MAFSFPSEVVVEFGASLFLYHRRKVCPRVSVCQRVCLCVCLFDCVCVCDCVSISLFHTHTFTCPTGNCAGETEELARVARSVPHHALVG